MLVFAFDRDWTVDVNPHPRHEAVPLDWVRHLAHETEHAVYATGNQTLADEAAIPGVVDIVGRHPDDWDEWLGDKRPNGRYERFPARRERLALIADLHPEADRYIVVDDLDLSDVSGWEHYHAWDFVPATKRGDIDPDLPWAGEVMSDGGLPTSAGIRPGNKSMLSSFLDEHSDAPGFRLRYAEDGTDRTRLLWDVSIEITTLSTATIYCTPLDPTADRFTVGIDDVKQLDVVEPSPNQYTAGAETPADRATGLRRLAEAKPGAVRIASLLALLDREDSETTVQREALAAAKHVAAVRPDDCTSLIPVLRSVLASDDCASPADALATLRSIGESDPGVLAPAIDDITPYLEAESTPVRRTAAKCVATVAEEYPGDAVNAAPALAEIVDSTDAGHQHAVYALSRISREHPGELEQVTETLAEVVLDDEVADGVRLNASAALGRVVNEHPSEAAHIVDDVTALFDVENKQLRNNAIGIVGDVAMLHTDLVEPHVEEIASLLTVDDAYTRINASGALGRVATDFPESVANLEPTFVELLTDDDPRVRENACWALGRIGTHEAESALEERRLDDENADVRERAAWALTQIDGVADATR